MTWQDLITERDGRMSSSKIMGWFSFAAILACLVLHYLGYTADAALVGIIAGFAGVNRIGSKMAEPKMYGTKPMGD